MYVRSKGHTFLRSACRKSSDILVLEGRLDLFPQERGRGVGGLSTDFGDFGACLFYSSNGGFKS